jgi:hypothetical protein
VTGTEVSSEAALMYNFSQVFVEHELKQDPVESLRIAAAALLEIESELSDDEPLYRIVDFFAAAQLIESGELRFSRADTFADPNEAVERLLRQLELSGPAGGCMGAGWRDASSAAQYHERIERSHYVSCWTQIPESVATWMLYSPDTNGVRISTTVGKLKAAVINLMAEWSIARLSRADLDNDLLVAVSGRLGRVRYESLPQLSQRVHRRVNAYGRIVERYQRSGKQLPKINEVSERYCPREEKRELTRDFQTCNLKDTSFRHEHEVRATVRFGEERCDQKMLDELKPLVEPSNNHHRIAKTRLSSWDWVRSEFEPYVFSNCPDGFVDSVALDQRCPIHRKNFMAAWFEQHDVRVEESYCFGYVPARFTLFPSW